MALNSFYTVAAMQGSKKAGKLTDYQWPPKVKEGSDKTGPDALIAEIEAMHFGGGNG